MNIFLTPIAFDDSLWEQGVVFYLWHDFPSYSQWEFFWAIFYIWPAMLMASAREWIRVSPRRQTVKLICIVLNHWQRFWYWVNRTLDCSFYVTIGYDASVIAQPPTTNRALVQSVGVHEITKSPSWFGSFLARSFSNKELVHYHDQIGQHSRHIDDDCRELDHTYDPDDMVPGEKPCWRWPRKVLINHHHSFDGGCQLLCPL